MDVRSIRSALVLLVTIFPLFTTSQAWANGWIVFAPFKLQASAGFFGALRSYSPGYDAQDTGGSFGVDLSQSGYIVDPGIASFALNISPTYAWFNTKYLANQSSLPATENTENDFLNYSFTLNLLNGSVLPFDAYLSAQSSTGLTTGNLGSRYESTYRTKEAGFNWRNTAFPMSFRFDENVIQHSFLSGLSNTATERDDLVRTLRVDGQSSKMRISIEHQILDDRLPQSDNDYSLSAFDLSHKFPWGRDSNLQSSMRYTNRSGFLSRDVFYIRETANVFHTEKVRTSSHYSFTSTKQEFTTDQHHGRFNFSHQLYNNLVTTFSTNVNSTQSDNAAESSWGSGIGTQYSKSGFFGAHITGGFYYSYDEFDRDSTAGMLEVIDEPHVIPLNGLILLEKRFVLNPTVIVTNDDSTLVYAEGVDYTLITPSYDLTQLQVIPGGRINSGETILVSYKIFTLPPQEFSQVTSSYNLGVTIGNLNMTHRSSSSDYELLSGYPYSFLENKRDDSTTIEYQWKLAAANVYLNATRSYFRFGEFEQTNLNFNQTLTWSLFGSTHWSLSTAQSFAESVTRNGETYSVTLTTTWRPVPSLSIRSQISAWNRQDEELTEDGSMRNDTYANFGLNANWQVRKFRLEFDYAYNQWVTEIDSFAQFGTSKQQSGEHRVRLNLHRRF